MQEDLLQKIAQNYGCAVAHGTYSRIRSWTDWWKGNVDGFHTYMENASFGNPVRRRMYGLRMAKKVCEDWASLLLNDKTYLEFRDPETKEWVDKILGDGDFWRRSNYLIEKAFATGTGACLLRVDGVGRKDWHAAAKQENSLDDGEERACFPTEVGVHGWTAGGRPVRFWFDFVDASRIVPISVESGVITEAAFVSRITLRGQEYEYLEVHIRQGDGYVIHNRYFCRKDGQLAEVHLPDMPPREIRTGCPYPFFAILTPNIQNTAEDAGGLGQSIYADALDCLRGVDLAFNNFCRDLRLGGKKVFINQSLIRRDDAGNLYTPDDVAQQLFMTVGDTDLAETPLIEEHNPSLRTEENRDAVQSQLDYLSFRCGLGTRQYLFSGVQGKAQLTATQYTGERQDMRQNLAKHSQNVTAYIQAILRPILWTGGRLLGLPFAVTNADVRYDDSYFADTESERSRDLREVEAGLMEPADFRKRWYGKE